MKWHALYDTRKHGDGNQIVALYLTPQDATNGGLHHFHIPSNHIVTKELDLQMPWQRTGDPASGASPLPGRVVRQHPRPAIVAPPPAPVPPALPQPEAESFEPASSATPNADVNARLLAKTKKGG